MSSEQLQDLERLRQLWLTDPIPNCSAYITALEHALWQQLPQPGVIGGFSWRLWGWVAAAGHTEGASDGS